MAKALTKIELLAKIDQLEFECAQHIAEQDRLAAELATAVEFIAAQRREIDTLYVAQRPSRAQPTIEVAQWPVITRGGVPYYKVRAIEHGRTVTTYKPVHGEDAARQSLRQSARTHLGRMAQSM